MQTKSEQSPSDTIKLQNLVLDLRSELSIKDDQILQLRQQYQHMLEQFRLSQQRQFGQSSESSPNQTELFDEAEQVLEASSDHVVSQQTDGVTRTSHSLKTCPERLLCRI